MIPLTSLEFVKDDDYSYTIEHSNNYYIGRFTLKFKCNGLESNENVDMSKLNIVYRQIGTGLANDYIFLTSIYLVNLGDRITGTYLVNDNGFKYNGTKFNISNKLRLNIVASLNDRDIAEIILD